MSCPNGTVLIRRTKKNDLIYAQKLQKSLRRQGKNFQSQPEVLQNVAGSHYAVMKSQFGEYYGASASLNVYGFPNVDFDQATISQIWVIGGTDGPEDQVNTVQAGWQVFPSLNDGDSATRLSTFWTNDGYKSGCYNLLCQGFFVVSHDFGPGSEILPLSTYNGIQESIEILISKDPKSGNWWLSYGKDKSLIGYWPKELFNKLDKATEIDWGGAVYSPLNKPSPPMGSGHLPVEGRNRTGCFKNIQLVNDKNELYDPKDMQDTIGGDIPTYYDIEGLNDSGQPDGFYFFYGGPGGYKQ